MTWLPLLDVAQYPEPSRFGPLVVLILIAIVVMIVLIVVLRRLRGR
ncbi:MAG: hypothetical protein GXX86_13635 [Propionibacterium sp.]|nr:hypothetical protein [Propionibacterium sp.]